MSRTFLFECAVEIGTETKQLKVYRSCGLLSERYTVYTCCFDIDEDGDEVSVEILKDDGVWYDFDGGKTNLSELFGEIIDANVAVE
jgi:hypothetical protein